MRIARRRWLLAAALAAPPLATAHTRTAPLALPVNAGGGIAAAGLAGAALTPFAFSQQYGVGAKGFALARPVVRVASARVARGSGGTSAALLHGALRYSATFEGGRRFWDQGLAGTGASESAVGGTASKGPAAAALAPAGARVEAPRRPAIEEAGRWRRMKASTKDDFRALFANLRGLRKSMVLPTSRAAARADAQAVARLFSQLRQLGWTVIGAVILYYLIRDSILYLLIPYLVYHEVFR